ncbi:MAG: tetratricopeptide repeat protein [Candidatus Rokubacteria bacterium]|nr:tetratricopeptide repeat protein [Candidatus Rokubacteria bacterium]
MEEFAQAVRGPDVGIDLARSALLIARLEYPSLDVERYLHRLDRLADEARARGPEPDRLRRLHRLREFLFEEVGFKGNSEGYFDPRNSFLNDVLERKLGIPITLSLVLMEVGRRLGLDIRGIGLPGHVVVGSEINGCQVLLDPFHGGAVLTAQTAQELVSRVLGRPVTLREEHFSPVTKRQFLTRMLNNLKAIYWRSESWAKALVVMERLLILSPDAPAEIRDRGTALVHLGEVMRGITDWERYLGQHPEAPDAETVRTHLRQIRGALATLN